MVGELWGSVQTAVVLTLRSAARSLSYWPCDGLRARVTQEHARAPVCGEFSVSVNLLPPFWEEPRTWSAS